MKQIGWAAEVDPLANAGERIFVIGVSDFGKCYSPSRWRLPFSIAVGSTRRLLFGGYTVHGACTVVTPVLACTSLKSQVHTLSRIAQLRTCYSSAVPYWHVLMQHHLQARTTYYYRSAA